MRVMFDRISKKEIEERVKKFFSNDGEIDSEDVRKIRRLAMSRKIRLGEYRKRFCSKCYSDLDKNGKVRISRGYKVVECLKCGNVRKWKLKG